jgi:hypothetical protein
LKNANRKLNASPFSPFPFLPCIPRRFRNAVQDRGSLSWMAECSVKEKGERGKKKNGQVQVKLVLLDN